MELKRVTFVLSLLLIGIIDMNDQIYTIGVEVDSSKKQPDYLNGNPRGVDESALDSNARVTGNYPRGFFPNQKIILTTNSKNSTSGSNPKQVFIKREDDEK